MHNAQFCCHIFQSPNICEAHIAASPRFGMRPTPSPSMENAFGMIWSLTMTPRLIWVQRERASKSRASKVCLNKPLIDLRINFRHSMPFVEERRCIDCAKWRVDKCVFSIYVWGAAYKYWELANYVVVLYVLCNWLTIRHCVKCKTTYSYIIILKYLLDDAV